MIYLTDKALNLIRKYQVHGWSGKTFVPHCLRP